MSDLTSFGGLFYNSLYVCLGGILASRKLLYLFYHVYLGFFKEYEALIIFHACLFCVCSLLLTIPSYSYCLQYFVLLLHEERCNKDYGIVLPWIAVDL